MPPIDSDLLRQFAEEGRQDAFRELVSRRIDLVYAAALRQVGGDAHRAKDIAQEVFIDLARKARSLCRHPSLLGWLYTSTHYAAVNLIRVEQRRKRREEEAHAMDNLTSSPAPEADWDQLRPVLDAAMHELDDRERRVVLLRFFDQQSFAAIGAELGLTENAAQKGAERALEKLHTLLTRRGVTSTATALGIALANQPAIAAPVGLAASVTGVALSGVAAGGGSAATAWLNLMAASKVTVSIAAVSVLALATAVYQSNRVNSAANELDRARGEQAALAARLADLNPKVKAAEKELLDRRVALARRHEVKAAAEALAKPSPEAVAAAARRARFEAARAKLGNSDQEVQQARTKRTHWQRLAEIRPFLSRLGLTTDQIRDFAQGVESRSPLSTAVRDKFEFGTAAGDPVARWAMANVSAAVREKFGDAAAEQLREFLDTLPARNLVNGLSADMFFADAPFTPQQTEQLIQIMAEARPAIAPTRTAHEFAAGVFERTLSWDVILTRASVILSPVQMQGLRSQAAEARMDAMFAAADYVTAPAK